jgi:hypothetical protein
VNCQGCGSPRVCVLVGVQRQAPAGAGFLLKDSDPQGENLCIQKSDDFGAKKVETWTNLDRCKGVVLIALMYWLSCADARILTPFLTTYSTYFTTYVLVLICPEAEDNDII